METECLSFYKCLMLKRKMQTVHKKVEANEYVAAGGSGMAGALSGGKAMCLNTRMIQTIQRKRRRDLSCCGRVWQRMTS